MKQNNNKNNSKQEESFIERCRRNEAIFASFIDLIPPKIYLNPDDHSNWTKMVINDSKKRKSSKKNENTINDIKKAKLDAEKKHENGKHTSSQMDIDDDEYNDEDNDEDDDEKNQKKQKPNGKHNAYDVDETSRLNKFDPLIFKTISQIIKDFEVLENKENKIYKTNQLVFNKSSSNNVPKSTAIKVFNKSQNKSSKQNSENQTASTPIEKMDSSESTLINNSEENKSEVEQNKKSLKRAAKFKEQKNLAIKRQRQRYDSHTEPQIVKIDHTEANSIENKKQILNKNGQVVFSKFDFTADKTLNTKKNKEEITVTNAKSKDYKKLLKKLQEKKEKVEQLKLTEPEKANELLTKDKWKTAFDKASGLKVKDDVNILKKAVKKIEKKKEKSKKNWLERNKAVEAKKQQIQEKRRKNIDARKEKNKETKLKKLKKKGRILPGF